MYHHDLAFLTLRTACASLGGRRELLGTLWFPGDALMIGRLLQAFAAAYCDENTAVRTSVHSCRELDGRLSVLRPYGDSYVRSFHILMLHAFCHSR